jgi:hypothetical protein
MKLMLMIILMLKIRKIIKRKYKKMKNISYKFKSQKNLNMMIKINFRNLQTKKLNNLHNNLNLTRFRMKIMISLEPNSQINN